MRSGTCLRLVNFSRCKKEFQPRVHMPEVYCIRASYGTYTRQFIDGGYVAIGWLSGHDLSHVKSKDELYPLYKKAHPSDTSNIVIGQQVGQIARFLFDIQAGDYIITPDEDTELLHVGVIQANPAYFYADASDGCRYHHRRPVKWLPETFKRSLFSVPL